MLFELVSYSGWLMAALGIGLVVGWQTYLNAPRRDWGEGWIVSGALAFVAGIIVAGLELLPGRYGLWLEIALLMIAFYVVGCFLGGRLKRLVGVSGGAAADIHNDATLDAERQATAKAAADRLAVELAAKAEAEQARAEVERRAAAAAKTEAERLAAAARAKAEAERRTAEAVAKAVAERGALAAKAEADRLALAAVAKEADGSASKTASDGPGRRRGASERRLPPPTRRRIVLWRKPPQRSRLNEKQIRPAKPRRVVWLQRVSRRLPGETRPPRPTRRRVLWLRRLPRPRPIGAPILHYIRRQTERT